MRNYKTDNLMIFNIVYTYSIYTLNGHKYLNNNNLYSYIQASRGIRTSVDASTWMLTLNDMLSIIK